MSASPKLCLLASPARPVSIAPNQQPISQPILTAVTAIQPKPPPPDCLRKLSQFSSASVNFKPNKTSASSPKLDLSKERVGRRLDQASRIAEHQGNAAAMATSELGIAKVFGLIGASDDYNPTDPSKANSMQDIGRMLLQSVGFASPDDASISLAIEANDAFVARLEEIRVQQTRRLMKMTTKGP